LKKYLVPVLSVLIIVAAAVSFQPEGIFTGENVDLWPVENRAFSLSEDMDGKLPGLLVSVASPGKGLYLTADYANIFLLREKDGSMKLMRPDRGTFSPDKKGLTYNPTGLFYDSSHSLLYVANYTANNILAYQVDTDKAALTLKAEIGSENTISPENVSVSPDGSFLVSANYDGNTVTAFDLTGEKARELWSRPVPLAHGVCISGDRVYATSLRLRSLFELNRKNGHLIRRSGQMGWNPSRFDLLWPTSVQQYPPDELILSDAHTGYVYLVDRATLKVKRYFGGNGPTFRFLNMPYTAVVCGDELLIASTYQRRLLIGSRRDFRFRCSFMIQPERWQYARNMKIQEISRLGTGWDDYQWVKGPKVNIFGNDYVMGYAHLNPVGGRLSSLVAPCREGSLFNSLGELYFLDRIELPEGFLLFTPQRGQGYCFYRESDASYFFPVSLTVDNWRIGNDIFSPEGIVDSRLVWERAGKMAQALKKARSPEGVLNSDALREIVFPELDREVFEKKLSEVFQTEPGTRFYIAYKAFRTGAIDIEELNSSAERFFREVANLENIPMDEMMTAHMLTGKKPQWDGRSR